MKRFFVLLLLVLEIGAVPAHAQWYKQVKQIFTRQSVSGILQTSPQLSAGTAAALEQAAHQAALKGIAPQHLLTAQHAVFTLKERDWLFRLASMDGTAFVIEETYQGKKYLWGVTAMHYLYRKPAMKHPAYFRAIRVPFVIQGSAGRNDIALFPIPEKFADQLTPLHLAQHDFQLGEELSSVGYWNKKIHVDQVRTVKEIYPAQVVTSLDIAPDIIREGTCGSPVLNQDGYVVGVHAGNSPKRQHGYVIPVSHIRQALQTYHEKTFTQPLLFNGVEIGQLAINEYLINLSAYQADQLISKKNLFLRQRQINYNHLETLVSFDKPITRVIFTVERNPLSSEQEDQKYYTFTISYDLQTGTISHSEPESRIFPCR